MKKILMLFIAALFAFPIIAQDFTTIPGCKIIKKKQYDGKSLWGHINGGADLYLEYGFKVLNFYELSIDTLKFRVEIYTMEDNKSAFGIYSLMVFNCNENPKLKLRNCISRYQIQMLGGNKYYSIVNEKGSDKEQGLGRNIAELICESAENGEIDVPEVLNTFSKLQATSDSSLGKPKSELRYFKGVLGLQNRFESWAEYFAGYSDFEIFILSIPIPGEGQTSAGKANLGLIRFNSGLFPESFPIREGFDRNDDGTEMHYLKKNSEKGIGLLLIYSDPDDADGMKFIKKLLLSVESSSLK